MNKGVSDNYLVTKLFYGPKEGVFFVLVILLRTDTAVGKYHVGDFP